MELIDQLDRATQAIRQRSSLKPTVALVLGSGLGGLANELTEPTVIPYRDIEGMTPSRVSGHAGNFVLGHLEHCAAIAMQGRSHLYEGLAPNAVVFGVRLMARLGAKTLLITNAAGGIDPDFAVGDLMRITDHLNLTGQNCLVGPNDDRLGPRFLDMSHAYDEELGRVAVEAASEIGFSLRSGVYAGLLGPTYETPAEVRMLRTLGASAVGMSTVLEVIAARHLGLRVLGISCITNAAAGLGDPLSHDEVEETARDVRPRFVGLVRRVVSTLAQSGGPESSAQS